MNVSIAAFDGTLMVQTEANLDAGAALDDSELDPLRPEVDSDNILSGSMLLACKCEEHEERCCSTKNLPCIEQSEQAMLWTNGNHTFAMAGEGILVTANANLVSHARSVQWCVVSSVFPIAHAAFSRTAPVMSL